MREIPAIPMVKVLIQFATAHNIPMNPRDWESIKRIFRIYSETVKTLN